MKKTLFSITMTVIALSGCAQEELIKISSGAGNGAVSATIVNEDTRTTLTEDGSVYHVNWVNGDKIAVVDGSNATGIFYCDKVDAPYSIFYLCDGDSVKFTDNLKAYYPASISEGKLAPVQIYGADGLFESPMYAEAEATTGDVKLEFKNLCGALKFNVTSSVAGAKVAGIALKADQGMSGEFTIADNAAVIAASENPQGVTLFCGNEGVELGSAPVSFVFAVPANTYTGLEIMVTMTDGKTKTYKLKDGNSLKVDRAQVKEGSFEITTLDEATITMGSSFTLSNGKIVNVTLSKDIDEGDILYNAYSPDGNSVIVEAVSKSGKPVGCSLSVTGVCTCDTVSAPGDKLLKYAISDVLKNVNVNVNYDLVAMARTDVQSQSFYKEVFIDAGCALDNFSTDKEGSGSIMSGVIPYIPEAYYELYGSFESKEWQDHVEYLWTWGSGAADSAGQYKIMVGSNEDKNGCLLYPDGEPRFKLMFSCGGKAEGHGKTLGAVGQERIRTFYRNGGSYSGSCAGCILAAEYWGDKRQTNAYRIHEGAHYAFSGMYIGPRYSTHLIFEPGNPLEKYFNRLKGVTDMDSLVHNGGCLLKDPIPEGTEVIGRFGPLTEGCVLPQGSSISTSQNKPCIWAFKKNAESGRLVVSGSHPETCNTANVTELYKAQLLYAMDGFGNAKPKATLENGVKRVMKDPEDPMYAGIGDGQYHHYLIYLPKPASSLSVTLTWSNKTCLDLLMKKGTYAFADSEPEYSVYAPAESAQVKSPYKITATNVPAGLWYISVHCNTKTKATIKTLSPSNGTGGYFTYSTSGPEATVLNGAAYSIVAEWKY